MGTVELPVPVNRSGENFSPMPFSAPPPLGSEMIWLEVPDLLLTCAPPAVAGADEQGKLVLSFQHNFHCERVNDPDNRRELENVLSEHLGGYVAVRCLMNGEWHPPAQKSTDMANAAGNGSVDTSQAPSESVENDSLIRRAQEELGAVAKLD